MIMLKHLINKESLTIFTDASIKAKPDGTYYGCPGFVAVDGNGIIDSGYIKWFTSDFANRIVANLCQLKRTNLTNKERIHEFKEVNSFLGKNSVDLEGKCRLYKLLRWLPVRLLIKII